MFNNEFDSESGLRLQLTSKVPAFKLLGLFLVAVYIKAKRQTLKMILALVFWFRLLELYGAVCICPGKYKKSKIGESLFDPLLKLYCDHGTTTGFVTLTCYLEV